MAKKEKIVDLKPKVENITEEQLKTIQNTIDNINRVQLDIGQIETRKHILLHSIARLNDKLTLMHSEFEKQYGTNDIDIRTGKINYPKENGEADKKD
jgi:hypothetical protein